MAPVDPRPGDGPRLCDFLADEIADACRAAATAFCRGVAEGWSKRDLAEWLAGAYGDVAHLLTDDELPPPPSSRGGARGGEVRRLDRRDIDGLLDPAWQDAVSCLEACAQDRTAPLLVEAFTWGSLAFAVDGAGATFFMPVHRVGLSLSQRLRSLILCDYLVRPADHRGALTTCSRCGVVLLGAFDRRRGHCSDHQRRSDVTTLGFHVLAAAENDDDAATG